MPVLGVVTDLATMMALTTRTRDAGTTVSPQMGPMAERAAHTATSLSSAPPRVVLSLWIVLVLGELTDLVPTPMSVVVVVVAILICRTGGDLCSAQLTSAAESTSTPRTLLTMVTVAPMPTTTSSAPRLDALSL